MRGGLRRALRPGRCEHLQRVVINGSHADADGAVRLSEVCILQSMQRRALVDLVAQDERRRERMRVRHLQPLALISSTKLYYMLYY